MAEQNARVAGREIHDSVGALLASVANGATVRRRPMASHVDSLSGAPFEHVDIEAEPYVLKHIGRSIDWVMDAMGDAVDGPPWVGRLWRAGVLDRLPASIDHTIAGAAWDPAAERLALLMRDITSTLVPPGSSRIPLAQHRGFLADMARMHAALWGFEDTVGLALPGARYRAFAPDTARRVVSAGHDHAVPRSIPGAWARLAGAAPAAYEVAAAIVADPARLVAALAATPSTLVHGDWKLGNLGTHADGRTVLLDWAMPSAGGSTVDLAWYLAVNCDRLPESKEDTIAAYRAGLEEQGVSTVDWFDRQLELALVGGFSQLGWSKTHDPAELGWWAERIVPVGRDLLR